MTVLHLDKTKPHPLGWVPTKLVDGDQLGDSPDPMHDLAGLYDITARAIVEGNGVRWSTPAIEAWVLATGGKRNALGTPVFTSATVVFLPPNGARAPVITPASPKKSSKAGWVIAGVVTVGGALAALAFRKKGRRS